MLDVVTLKEDDPVTGVPKGAIGTVVYIHDGGEAYTVEFIDEDRDTYEGSFNREFTEDELQPKEAENAI
jgi:uncharacterized protein YodC (DUF2158 family)